jgi:hypothetical protein
MLVAPDDTVAAARALFSGSYEDDSEEQQRLEREFVRLARRDLGIKDAHTLDGARS